MSPEPDEPGQATHVAILPAGSSNCRWDFTRSHASIQAQGAEHPPSLFELGACEYITTLSPGDSRKMHSFVLPDASMILLFWLGIAGVFYAYFGYPAILLVWGKLFPNEIKRDTSYLPRVSIVLPVHNEEANLAGRLANLQELQYPEDLLELIVVSDGSTDSSAEIVRNFQAMDSRIRLIEIPDRQGKGGALNAGVEAALGEIIVFTDAAIVSEPESLRALLAPMSDPNVGCVSAEDFVKGKGGEALYVRYDFLLRRMESKVASVVGSSGAYYAQRRELVPNFPQGIAPDFLSVLHVVEQGFRAISEPSARGFLGAVGSSRGEFRRKVRTLLRGMAGVAAYRHLLNPLRSGRFAFILSSHKIARWLVPFFLISCLIGNIGLMTRPMYREFLFMQTMFYGLGFAYLGGLPVIQRLLFARIAGYFVNVNVAIIVACWRYIRGDRMEVWHPSRR